MKVALAVTLIVAAAVGFSTREAVAGSPAMWLGLILPYLVLAALGVRRWWEDGTLRDVLRPRAGDVTVGIGMGALVYGAAWGVRQLFFASAAPQVAWLYRIALQLGVTRPSPAALAIIAGIGVLEEMVWRGLVLGAVTDSLGTRRAWPVTAGLYALAHAPTIVTLSDPMAGPNPLLVFAALGAGLVWSFAASIAGRLPPVVISHAAFSYFAVALLLPRFG